MQENNKLFRILLHTTRIIIMSRTTKDRELKSHKSNKANPLGVCRCLQCSAVKRKHRNKSMVEKIKKHNRIVTKAGEDDKIKRGHYYS